MTLFTTFSDYYKSDVSNCPDVVIAKYVREAVIEWCERTMLVKADAEDIYLWAETAEYDITFSDDYDPVLIDTAFLGDESSDDTVVYTTSERELNKISGWQRLTTSGSPTHVFLTQANKVRVYPIPDENIDDILLLSCVVKPTRDATEIDDIVYTDHVEDIRHGVLMRLLDMKGRPWYDPKGALDHKFRWSVSIGNGKRKAVQGKNNVNPVMDYSGSSFF